MNQPLPDKPAKRVLMLADFACATGFAQVAQNIAAQILNDAEINYQVDVVGINYFGLPTEWQNVYPRLRIFPAAAISGGDVFGRNAFLNMLATGAYDLAWILQDTFNVEPIANKILEIRNSLIGSGKKSFKYIFYFPIDAKPKENWVTESVSKADVPVVYTQYGYDECIKHDPGLKDRLLIVPHGIDEKVFKPVDDQMRKLFRHEYFLGRADDKFLVTNVNRNQPRKDVARTMQAFRLFKNRCPEAILYLHMKQKDVAYDLGEVARDFDLNLDEDFIVPKDFNEHDGISADIVNLIYNASDCITTTTLGEGWGLSITEAMAAKCPVVAPNHTSLTEMVGADRGLLFEAGKTISEWVVIPNDNERLRPLSNVADMVEKLYWLRNNKNSQEVKDMVERAHEHVLQNLTWEKVGQKWREIFRKASVVEKVVKVGRNDSCPCGSGKKYKRCHGA